MVGRHLQIQGILGCNDIDLVPHQPPEKGNQVPFRAADLAHTDDTDTLRVNILLHGEEVHCRTEVLGIDVRRCDIAVVKGYFLVIHLVAFREHLVPFL